MRGKSQKRNSRPNKDWRDSSSKKYRSFYLDNVFLPGFIWKKFCLTIYLQIFVGKEIFGHGFGLLFSLNICFVDFFLKYFSVRISFDNCFVEILLQGVCGRNVSSNTFSVECISSTRCLVWKDFGVKPVWCNKRLVHKVSDVKCASCKRRLSIKRLWCKMCLVQKESGVKGVWCNMRLV